MSSRLKYPCRFSSAIHFQAAERYGSAYAVILGGAEVDSRCVKVKHLGERREEQVAVDALSSFAFE